MITAIDYHYYTKAVYYESTLCTTYVHIHCLLIVSPISSFSLSYILYNLISSSCVGFLRITFDIGLNLCKRNHCQ